MTVAIRKIKGVGRFVSGSGIRRLIHNGSRRSHCLLHPSEHLAAAQSGSALCPRAPPSCSPTETLRNAGCSGLGLTALHGSHVHLYVSTTSLLMVEFL